MKVCRLPRGGRANSFARVAATDHADCRPPSRAASTVEADRPSQKEVPLTMITTRELATVNRRSALPLCGATAPVLHTAR
jgi:hypothetical protein